MAIDLATQYLPYVDEQFTTESKMALISNRDFDFTGANTVKVYKINTAQLNNYDRDGEGKYGFSRYGKIENLGGSTEEFIINNDKSFTFAIDRLDEDETKRNLQAASALARQIREVVIPHSEHSAIAKILAGAGTKAEALKLTKENIYDEILKANSVLDEANVPTYGRVLLVNAKTYMLLKQNKDFLMSTDIAQDMKIKGVIAMVDGLTVVRLSESVCPDNFGFALVHPSAIVFVQKLESYRIHENPPGISGALVEGRIVFDTFILDNKKTAIYSQVVQI
ncbi:hypothetical protein [Neofamilia massiliensis]|uniref:hypothetical protein n=1 Tax=Neofamilia massiliensis TaxID=1673724 RepID=UPI0006BB92B3|nr:hypothetical protein [Neofamilia massiliensis]